MDDLTSNDRASVLRALRDLYAETLSGPLDAHRDVAVIGRELRETVRELATLGGADADDVDEIAAQRAKRRGAAADQ